MISKLTPKQVAEKMFEAIKDAWHLQVVKKRIENINQMLLEIKESKDGKIYPDTQPAGILVDSVDRFKKLN